MRVLAVNLGNTSVRAAYFAEGQLRRRWSAPWTPGLLAKGFTRWLGRLPALDRLVMASVVPARTREVGALCRRATGQEPRFLTGDGPHSLAIHYARPRELGADRLAAALGARELFPRQHLLIVDCGTATTVTAVRRDGHLLGGAIFPGAVLWAESLHRGTAQLPAVPLREPRQALGRSPSAAVLSGIWFGHAGAIRSLVERLRAEAFGRARAVVVGTGGNAAAAAREGIFQAVEKDLVLKGLDIYARDAKDW